MLKFVLFVGICAVWLLDLSRGVFVVVLGVGGSICVDAGLLER